jgi:hypothetical protein
MRRIKKSSSGDIEFNDQIITLYTNGLTCNIHDYIEWTQDISILTKKEYDKLTSHADYFVAYSSYINAFDLNDTPKLRKEWYKKMRGKIFMKSMEYMGI